MSSSPMDIRVVSGNAVMQRNLFFFTVKKSWLAPTELVHLFRERGLSKNLFSIAVSPQEKHLVVQNPRRQLDPTRMVDRRYTRPRFSST